MFRNLLIAVSCVALSVGVANPRHVPILVELFTSEGCSSCPPADLALQQLDSQVIVLSEHVDYWDQQGWKDRFSSHEFTVRQENYAKQFRLEGPYTPQMVVDGSAQFVGGDYKRTAAELEKASQRPKADVGIERTTTGVRVNVDNSPASADVMLALAEDTAVTKVAGGENKGHELKHVAVVRSFRKIGTVKRGVPFVAQVTLPGGNAWQRVVVFLQEPGQARVYGAAMSAAAQP